MQGVKCRHGKVKIKKQLGWSCPARIVHKIRSGPEMLFKMVIIFDAFHSQKNGTQKHGDEEKAYERPRFAGAGRVDGQCHRETAGEKNRRIETPEPKIAVTAGGGEAFRIEVLKNGEGGNEAAKEHDFRGKKDP